MTDNSTYRSISDVAAHYDRVTTAWLYLLGEDLHYGYFEHSEDPLAEATARLTERMVATAQLRPGLKVLDVGCGIGTAAFALVNDCGCRVTGISISEVGLDIARRRASELGVTDRVLFRYGDATSNTLPDSTFDRVWVMESSHLMMDKQSLFSECARVLRPGGLLALCDIIALSELTLSDTMRYARDFLILDQVFGRARMETLDVYTRLAMSSNLDVIQRDDISASVRPTFSAWRKNASCHRGVAESLLSPEAVDRFVESTIVLERLWDAGKLGYGILAARKPVP